MKKTTYTAAIIAAAMFSGAVFAEMDNADDVLYGSRKVTSSPGTPYVATHSGPQGTEDDVLYGREQLKSSAFSPYERVSNDRDNRDNLIDEVS
ncbi:MAG: hypothetical protein GY703_10655 [Gammaproteobacteria bacterium]|nr:hypothetical protein [Gammaproteobacteria bacterium]